MVSARHHRHAVLPARKSAAIAAFLANLRETLVFGWNEVEAKSNRQGQDGTAGGGQILGAGGLLTPWDKEMIKKRCKDALGDCGGSAGHRSSPNGGTLSARAMTDLRSNRRRCMYYKTIKKTKYSLYYLHRSGVGLADGCWRETLLLHLN